MSKHLILNGGSDNFLLADGTDLEGLRKTVEEGMQTAAVLQLPVYLPDRLEAPVTVLLNCQAAASVVLVEL